ncbi:type IV pilus modification PilV family protein [Pilimelia anulata]|nr:type II secretion system protein [Pilimelia anulata]
MTRRGGVAAGDAGFTLVEALVSIGLVGTVMASLAAFFVSGLAISHDQGQREVAAQLAGDAMDHVRTLPSADVGERVRALAPRTALVNGVPYTQTFTACWQPATGGACAATRPAIAADAALVRVTVTVAWPARECAGGTCRQSTATLVSVADAEPVVET